MQDLVAAGSLGIVLFSEWLGFFVRWRRLSQRGRSWVKIFFKKTREQGVTKAVHRGYRAESGSRSLKIQPRPSIYPFLIALREYFVATFVSEKTAALRQCISPD